MNPEDSFTHTEASGECEQAAGVHSFIQKGLGCGRRACEWYITGKACGHGHGMYGRERTTDNINEQRQEQPRMDDGVEEGTKGNTKGVRTRTIGVYRTADVKPCEVDMETCYLVC